MCLWGDAVCCVLQVMGGELCRRGTFWGRPDCGLRRRLCLCVGCGFMRYWITKGEQGGRGYLSRGLERSVC